MNHRLWFTLILKAEGVLLLAFALAYVPNMVNTIVQTIGTHAQTDSFSGIAWALLTDVAIPYLSIVVESCVGAYLLFGGKWLIDRCMIDAARTSTYPACSFCGYDLTATAPGAPCPECGQRRKADPAAASSPPSSTPQSSSDPASAQR